MSLSGAKQSHTHRRKPGSSGSSAVAQRQRRTEVGEHGQWPSQVTTSAILEAATQASSGFTRAGGEASGSGISPSRYWKGTAAQPTRFDLHLVDDAPRRTTSTEAREGPGVRPTRWQKPDQIRGSELSWSGYTLVRGGHSRLRRTRAAAAGQKGWSDIQNMGDDRLLPIIHLCSAQGPLSLMQAWRSSGGILHDPAPSIITYEQRRCPGPATS